MTDEPAGAAGNIVSSWETEMPSRVTYMKPAPPVIMIFLTSGNGSNLVLPVKMGASFQMP